MHDSQFSLQFLHDNEFESPHDPTGHVETHDVEDKNVPDLQLVH